MNYVLMAACVLALPVYGSQNREAGRENRLFSVIGVPGTEKDEIPIPATNEPMGGSSMWPIESPLDIVTFSPDLEFYLTSSGEWERWTLGPIPQHLRHLIPNIPNDSLQALQRKRMQAVEQDGSLASQYGAMSGPGLAEQYAVQQPTDLSQQYASMGSKSLEEQYNEQSYQRVPEKESTRPHFAMQGAASVPAPKKDISVNFNLTRQASRGSSLRAQEETDNEPTVPLRVGGWWAGVQMLQDQLQDQVLGQITGYVVEEDEQKPSAHEPALHSQVNAARLSNPARNTGVFEFNPHSTETVNVAAGSTTQSRFNVPVSSTNEKAPPRKKSGVLWQGKKGASSAGRSRKDA